MSHSHARRSASTLECEGGAKRRAQPRDTANKIKRTSKTETIPSTKGARAPRAAYQPRTPAKGTETRPESTNCAPNSTWSHMRARGPSHSCAHRWVKLVEFNIYVYITCIWTDCPLQRTHPGAHATVMPSCTARATQAVTMYTITLDKCPAM